MDIIQQSFEYAPRCPWFDWDSILKEAHNLPYRNEKPYKKAELREQGKMIILGLVLLPGGLLLAYVDIYTRAAIPFGWLLGLVGAVLGVLLLFFGPLILLFTFMSGYSVAVDRLLHFIGIPFDCLGMGAGEISRRIRGLKDFSLQLILPSSRTNLADFVLAIDKRIGCRLDPHYDQVKQANMDVRMCFGRTRILRSMPWRKDDNVQYLVAIIDVQNPQKGTSPKKCQYVEIILMAVKSKAGNWYLTLPNHTQADWWIKFLY